MLGEKRRVRRPDRHYFGAVKLLQKTYEQEHRFCFTLIVTGLHYPM